MRQQGQLVVSERGNMTCVRAYLGKGRLKQLPRRIVTEACNKRVSGNAYAQIPKWLDSRFY
jgi:hypothetical protein